MFKNIKIKNFRGIKELEIDDFKQVNLFVGANECGKTSVLESLYASLNPDNAALLINTNANRKVYDNKFVVQNETTVGKVLQDVFANSLVPLFYKCETDPPIELISSFVDNEKLTLKISLEYSSEAGTSAKVVKKPSSLKNSFNYSAREELESYAHIKDLANPILIEQSKIEVKQKLDGFIISSRLPKTDELVEYLDSISKNREEDTLTSVIQKVNLKIDDYKVLTDKTVVIGLKGLKHRLPLEYFGDGLRKIFTYGIYVSIASSENKQVLLIDEIENGLHYTAQEKLWKWLFEIAKEKNIQIFATTHSMDCVKAFVEASESNEDAMVYRLEKDKADQVKAIPIEPSIAELIVIDNEELR